MLRELILPALMQVGREWEQGTLAVSQEHFASNVIRARLLSLARLWGRGAGPVAVLACAPGEQHDISLLAFGLVLRSHGWRIIFLGADTPITTLAQAAEGTGSALTVLASFDPARRRRSQPPSPSGQKAPLLVLERPRRNRAALQEAPRAAARR